MPDFNWDALVIACLIAAFPIAAVIDAYLNWRNRD